MKTPFLLAALLSCSTAFAQPPVPWYSVADKKIQAISGIALIDNEHFLVVHDRKKPEHPRLGIIEWPLNQNPVLKKMDWCDMDNIPRDLEAITTIPEHKNQYLVLESSGKVTRIQLNGENQCSVTARFDLPDLTEKTNMEGLSLHCFTPNQCLLAWADRGDDKRPAVMSWASFDIDSNKLGETTDKPHVFDAPFPSIMHKSISDIAIDDKGVVWVGSTSDPGDDGHYASGLYQLGKFTQTKNGFNWEAFSNVAPLEKYECENVKVEGLAFTSRGLIMATDDENLGAKVAILPLK